MPRCWYHRRGERCAYLAFTPRERGVVDLVMLGLPNKQIARRLNWAEQSVKNLLSRLYLRLGLRCRTDLVLFVTRPGCQPGRPFAAAAEEHTNGQLRV